MVDANKRSSGVWYPGKIMGSRADGTFDISYDSGYTETQVAACMIRPKADDVEMKSIFEVQEEVCGVLLEYGVDPTLVDKVKLAMIR
jgi:hypothetical protein